jgi:acetylornithine deacetylase/succinyl-diaminopimelate desuccinylase-like protein
MTGSVAITDHGTAMSEFRYPAWQKPLQEAVNEPNLEKLSEKVHAAETAVLLRLQELSVLPGSQDELDALQKACEELLKIQTHRLKWPNTFGGSSRHAE